MGTDTQTAESGGIPMTTDTLPHQPNSSDSESETEIEGILTTPPPTVTSHPKRNMRAPTRDNDPHYSVSSYGSRKRTTEHATVAQDVTTSDPRTYAQAMACPDAAEWELACDDERRAFERMGVYEVGPHPKGRKVVGSRWVFRIKRGPDGTIQKYKARVIAQGFTQVENINYNKTFAPVAKFASLRTILALATEEDLEVHQMDVKSAYLNDVLQQEIFMEALPGLDDPEGMDLRLIKAVYGTKQGVRVWHDDIRS